MPRTLPWLSNPVTTDSKPKATTTVKRRKVEPSSPASSDALDEFIRTPKHAAHRTTHARTTLRSPSTSPPPAPPQQEFMRPGWEHDDGWRMVTDEFISTAKLFTAHLAYTEYKRQKALAKRRQEERRGAESIARPVVGQLSNQGKRQKLGELQRKAVRNVLKDEVDGVQDDDPWMGTQLAGLMMSPTKRERLGAGNVVGRSNTRAAAGFDRARPLDVRGRPLPKQDATEVERREVEEDETDEDLDAVKPTRAMSRAPTTLRQSRALSPTPSAPKSGIVKQTTIRQPSQPPPTCTNRPSDLSSSSRPSSHRKCKSIDRDISRPPPKREKSSPSPPAIKLEPDFGFPAIPQPTQGGASVVARRREARLKREREEKEKIKTESQVHELPTFLF